MSFTTFSMYRLGILLSFDTELSEFDILLTISPYVAIIINLTAKLVNFFHLSKLVKKEKGGCYTTSLQQKNR